MASETEIALQLKIDTADSAKTVKELKLGLKSLKDELNNVETGSSQFKKLSKAINETEGKLGDLNDSFNTLKGSGIERTTNSLNTLKEGFATLDSGKIKAGFSGLGAAMKAVPIFLLIEGVRLLIENFEKIFNWLKPVNRELEKLTVLTEQQAKVTKALIGELNREIAILEASGASHDTILAKKKELIEAQIKEAEANIKLRQEKIKDIAANDDVWESIDRITASIFRKVGASETADAIEQNILKKKAIRAEEDLKSVEDSEQRILDLRNSFRVEELKVHKEHLDKKVAQDKLYSDANLAEYNKRAERENALIDAQEAKEKASKLARLDYDAQLNAIKENMDAEAAQKKRDALAAEEREILDSEKKKVEGYKKTQDSQLELTKKTMEAAQALTDLYFAHQLKKNKGNAAAELEIRKKQFKVNKAFGIVNAVVDGVGAVQKALNNPYPLNLILAVLSGVLAAANVAKIASSKFEGGEASGGGGADIGSISTAAPAIPQPNNTVTKINDDGSVDKKEPVVKAIVVESDITEKQQRVNTIQESAQFG